MPVIAVGAAIYAGATIATVGVAAMSTMAVVSAVGAIAAGIGVVTGNKELTRVGAIVGLVGGVGALAQSQGWLASSELANSGADSFAAASGSNGAANAAGTEASVVMDQAGAVVPQVTAPTAGVDVANAANAAPAATPIAGGQFAGATPNDLLSANGGTATAANAPSGGALSMLGSVTDWMEKNKNVTAMLSSFVGGAADQEKDAKVKQAEALAAQAESNTRIQQQQMANGSAIPDLTGLKVDPNKNVYGKTTSPVYYGVKPVGLINK